MTRARIFSAFVAMAAVCLSVPAAQAVDPPDLFLNNLLQFTWTGGGDGTTWQNQNNWTAPTFPGGYPYTIPVYPYDANRPFDEDDVTIVPVIGANLSVPRTSNLTLNIADLAPTSVNNGEDHVYVASLKLGSTTNPVATNVTSTTAGDATPRELLIFQNFEINDVTTNPGDPEEDPPILPEPIYSFNQQRALIWSTGVSGVTNEISADIRLDDNTTVEGDRDLTISGDIYEGILDRDEFDAFNEGGGLQDPDDPPPLPSSLHSLLSGGATLYITGNIYSGEQDSNAASLPIEDRGFFINSIRGFQLPTDPQVPGEPPPVPRQGNIDISGQIIGEGDIYLGAEQGSQNPISTIFLRGDNSGFTGRIYHSRSNLVLDHDNALGAPTDQMIEDPENPGEFIEDKGDYKTYNPNQGFGFNFISTNNSRNIGTDMTIAQWQTIKGGLTHLGDAGIGDNSIKFSGNIQQSNTRGWVNLLPYNYATSTGPTLTLSGYQSSMNSTDGDAYRIYTVDGTGKTLITGGIHDRPVDPDVTSGNGHFRKRGTGTVVIDYDETNVIDTATDYTGHTWVQGGNLHFAHLNDLPNPGAANLGQIHSTAGAIGFDEGVLSANGPTFLAMLNNRANPNQTEDVAPYYLALADNIRTVYSRYDHGGLMLGASEYGSNLNFTTGSLANAQDMSLAAWETGSTYTGSITPAGNLYRLGGGPGRLTLPNQNQLNGARSLLVTNGGEVFLDDTNNYTGSTTIRYKSTVSLTNQATNDGAGLAVGDDVDEDDDGAGDQFNRPTLIAPTLADGGVDSSIGKSSSAASNLWLQGATLKYTGGAVATDRLFTIGTAGGTIDASGSGALVFENINAVAVDVAESRTALMNGGISGNDNNEVFGIPSLSIPFDTSDLVAGMTITGVKVTLAADNYLVDDEPDPLRITNVAGPDVVQVGETDLEADELDDEDEIEQWPGYSGSAFGIHTISFGPAPDRFLTLTGTSAHDNTMTPVVGDASDIGNDTINPTYGSVGIRKTGTGTWVLAAENTYTGQTQVQEGILKVTGSTGSGDTIVSGGTLKGSGNVGGNLIVQDGGTVDPGLSPGELTVEGDYTQDVGGTLKIEIAGTGTSQYDRLTVDNGVSIGLDGDYNENDRVDAGDYIVWRDALTAGGSIPNDPTGGLASEADFTYWRDNYGDVPGAGSNTSVATLAGTILIDLLSFSPINGNTFTILTAGTVTDGGVTLSGESAGFSLVFNPTSVVLQYGGGGGGSGAAAVPEPSSILLGSLALVGLVSLSRRRG